MPKEHIDVAKYHPVTGEPLDPIPSQTKIPASGGAYISRPGNDELPVNEAKPKQISIQTTPVSPQHPQSIKLTYAYIGNCPNCLAPVKTLEADVLNKHVAIAYCTNCDKQIESQTVKRLEVKKDAKSNGGETKARGSKKVRINQGKRKNK